MQKNQKTGFKVKLPVLAAAMVSALAAMSAQAFEFDTGNDDLAVRWDNTVKLNYGYRMEGQNPDITRSPNYNDGDLNFRKHAPTSERLDVLSEFELNYKKEMGFRVSGDAWYDAAYNDLNASNNFSNHLVGGKPASGLSRYTDRYFHGPSGEVLDAFVFRNFDFGEQTVNLKAGKTTQYWGESLLTPIHGLNYGQSPVDLGKLYSVPGTEAKELFLPREQLSTNWTLSPELSLGAQYFLDWQHSRFPEAGSYMGMYDIALDGGESAYVPGLASPVPRGNDLNPNKSGDFSLQAKWSPNWLDGTLGLFYRRTADTLPDTVLLNRPGAPANWRYLATYASDIDVFGLSLAKNIAGVSVGADVNVRHNMPLASQQVIQVIPGHAEAPGIIGALPQNGETDGARGNTFHLVLNGLATFGKTPVFDSASLLGEFTYNRLLSVTQGYAQYRGNPAYTGIDKATTNYFGFAMNFTPTWFQVYPGVDLSMPLSYSVGLKGQSAVPLGGNEHAGYYSAGLSALVHSKYTIDLKYSDFFGPYVTNAAGQITSSAGLGTLLKDRGTLSLTFKTTF